MCFPSVVFFPSPHLFVAVILVYFPLVVFSCRCVCSLWSLFRYIVFYLPVSLEFVVFVHCGHLVYFPSIVFFPLPCLFVMVVIMSSLCVLYYLCFPFVVFVQFGHISNLVDESGFSEEIHHIHCLFLVIFQ
jgi:hypothetical protein